MNVSWNSRESSSVNCSPLFRTSMVSGNVVAPSSADHHDSASIAKGFKAVISERSNFGSFDHAFFSLFRVTVLGTAFSVLLACLAAIELTSSSPSSLFADWLIRGNGLFFTVYSVLRFCFVGFLSGNGLLILCWKGYSRLKTCSCRLTPVSVLDDKDVCLELIIFDFGGLAAYVLTCFWSPYLHESSEVILPLIFCRFYICVTNIDG